MEKKEKSKKEEKRKKREKRDKEEREMGVKKEENNPYFVSLFNI